MEPNNVILLVEDDQVDQLAVRRAFKSLDITKPLEIVENGQEALDYLRDSETPQPSLILLDINMPIMNGIEFLQVIKADEQLKLIPTVVLTTSHDQKDIVNSYGLGAAGYMVKPVDYQHFVSIVQAIDLYWSLAARPELTKPK